MSDKLQKTDSAIVPASKIADKIASALKDDKPANTGMRWPNADDVCKCGHTYSEHNYSDSLGSRKDPLGFMYECRGGGFDTPPANLRGMKARCMCEQFEVATVGIGADAIVVGSVTSKVVGMREWTRQQAKVANFGELAERAGMSPKTLINTDFEALELRTIAASLVPAVTLPTESSAKSFEVKVIGENGELVDLVDVGCGAEFPTRVNDKFLRCKKWRGHEGDHEDKLNGVPIKWANK